MCPLPSGRFGLGACPAARRRAPSAENEVITCRELDRFVVDYLDGKLPAVERIEFERHLAACGICVKFLASYRRTIALGKSAFAQREGTAPLEVPEPLVQAILSARRASR
jgi:anti-sigma factor RsiW